MKVRNYRTGRTFKQKWKNGVQQTAQSARKHPQPEGSGNGHMLKIRFPDRTGMLCEQLHDMHSLDLKLGKHTK